MCGRRSEGLNAVHPCAPSPTPTQTNSLIPGLPLVTLAQLRSGGDSACDAHAQAGLINGARCLEKAPCQSEEHPDGCVRWNKLQNVVIEGGGMLDANASDWYNVWAGRPGHGPVDYNMRPMMLDMMWVDGLTIQVATGAHVT